MSAATRCPDHEQAVTSSSALLHRAAPSRPAHHPHQGDRRADRIPGEVSAAGATADPRPGWTTSALHEEGVSGQGLPPGLRAPGTRPGTVLTVGDRWLRKHSAQRLEACRPSGPDHNDADSGGRDGAARVPRLLAERGGRLETGECGRGSFVPGDGAVAAGVAVRRRPEGKPSRRPHPPPAPPRMPTLATGVVTAVLHIRRFTIVGRCGQVRNRTYPWSLAPGRQSCRSRP